MRFVLLCLLILPGPLLPAGSACASPLDEARAKYAAATNKINQVYLASLEQAKASCLKALKARSRFYQAKSRHARAIEKIRKALSETNDVPAVRVGIPELDGIYRRLLIQKGKALAEKDEQTEKLLIQYLKRLAAVQKQLVQNEDIASALLAREERSSRQEALTKLRDRIAERREFAKSTGIYTAGGMVPLSMRKGLVLHLGFDRDENGKVTDRSGRNHHAKVNDAAWTPKGKVRGGYEFDGKGNHLKVGNEPLLSADKGFTISLWIFPTFETGNGTVISLQGAQEFTLGVGLYSNYLNYFAFRGQQAMCTEDQRLALKNLGNGWRHLAVTYNGAGKDAATNYTLSLDGNPVQVTTANTCGPGGNANVIGGNTIDSFFTGTIDEVLVYDRPLSEKEIEQLYRVQKSFRSI